LDSDATSIVTRLAGSPTFAVDGVDRFDADRAPAALTCRGYRTEAGSLAGIPDVTDLTAALRTKVAT
jgi:hypothetical protein